MKIIHARLHGALDYLTVAFLLVSPWLFNMPSLVATITYCLAAIQLLLTVSTAYQLGIIKKIPFLLHGFIEFTLSFCLVFAALYLRSRGYTQGFEYFIYLAIVYMLVFNFTDFSLASQRV
jgi:hypothetical protein